MNQVILIALAAILCAYGIGLWQGASMALKPKKPGLPRKRFKAESDWNYKEVNSRN